MTDLANTIRHATNWDAVLHVTWPMLFMVLLLAIYYELDGY